MPHFNVWYVIIIIIKPTGPTNRTEYISMRFQSSQPACAITQTRAHMNYNCEFDKFDKLAYCDCAMYGLRVQEFIVTIYVYRIRLSSMLYI